MDDVRNAVVELEIVGADNYRLEGKSTMAEISRDPLDLVKQTISEHQYPDGFALFLGTLFAPTQDRDVRGSGFTHKEGDVVQDLHAQTGCSGKPGHHLQGGAALELRYFRSDEKPCTAWAFVSLTCGPKPYPCHNSGMQFRGWIEVANPLNTASRFPPIRGEI